MKESINILVVEDETIIAMEIQDRLVRLGYNVSGIITSGEDAVKKVSKLKPDLVLMDIMLEGKMDGIQAAELIRENFDIPVVYVSAYSDEDTLQRAKITEPYGYILKPLEERELQTIIEIVLYKHHMEKKVKEDERRFSTTLKSIGEGVITTNTQNRITFMNRVAEKLTGWSNQEGLGKKLKDVFHVIDEKSEKPIKNPSKRMVTEKVIDESSNHNILIDKEGRRIHIKSSAAPIVDDRGESLGVVFTFSDITSQKKLEGQLRQAQKMKAIGTLAGGVAHDFNNLLTAILGCTNMVMTRVDRKEPIYDDLKDIQVSAERAADLTRQLLLFSRNQPMKFVLLNLNEIIEDLLMMLHRLIGEDIFVATALESNLWTVRIDKSTMEQVIMNLAVNARDAMPDGGKLTIKTENVVIDKGYCQTVPEAKVGKFVQLTITDTGFGMSRETQERIFEPFFSTKGPGKGTGLGLSVVYGIVKQQDGWIHVYSEINQGTSFKMYLPAVKEKTKEDSPRKNVMKELKGHGEHILVVEDEKNVRDFVKKALIRNGYNVTTVKDAKEAITLFKKNIKKYQMVFSDVVLPGKSGIQLIEEIIQSKADTKILLSSGYTDRKSQWPIIQKKGIRYLQKPFSTLGLLQAVHDAFMNT